MPDRPRGRPQFVDTEGNPVEIGNDGAAQRMADQGLITTANPTDVVFVRVRNPNGDFEARSMTFQNYSDARRDAIRQGDHESVMLVTGDTSQTAAAIGNVVQRGDQINRAIYEDMAGVAFVQAAGNTVSFGAGGALQEHLRPGISSTVADIAAHNPLATGAGIVTGIMASALMPGGGLPAISRMGARLATGGRAARSAGLLHRGMQAGQTTRSTLLARSRRYLAKETSENLAFSIQAEAGLAAVQNRDLSVQQIIGDAGIGTLFGLGLGGITQLGRLGMAGGRGIINEARVAVRANVAQQRSFLGRAAGTAQRNLDEVLGPSTAAIRQGFESFDSGFRNMSSVVNGSYDEAFRGIAITGNANQAYAQAVRNLGIPESITMRGQSLSQIHKRMFDLRAAAGRSGKVDVVAKIDTLLDDASIFGDSASIISRSRRTIRDIDMELAPLRQRLGDNPEQAIKRMTQDDLTLAMKAVRSARRAADDMVAVGAGRYAKQVVKEADRIDRAIAGRAKAYNKAAENLRKAEAEAQAPTERLMDKAAEDLIFSRALLGAIPLGSIGALLGSAGGAGLGVGAGALLQFAMMKGGPLARLGRIHQVFTKFEKQLIKNNQRLESALQRADRGFAAVQGSQKPASAIVAALRDPDKRDEALEDLRAQIARLTTDPELLQRELTLMAMPTSEIDEGMGDLLQFRALEVLSYLQQQFPQIVSNPLNPNAPATPISATEMDRFANAYEALENPMSLYDNLNTGRITKEAVDAVRTALPEVFTEIGRNVAAVIANHMANGDVMPYQMITLIAQSFGIESDPSQSSQFIAAMQSTAAQTEQQADSISTAGQLQGPRRGTGTSLGQANLTASQRIEQG